MKYICLINPVSKVIDNPIEVEDSQGAYDFARYRLEAMNRGEPWEAYMGDEPFEFKEDEE